LPYAGGVFDVSDPNERKFRKYNDRELLGVLKRYIMRYKKSLVLVFFFLFFTAAVGVIYPYLLGSALNDIVTNSFNGVLIAVGGFVVLYVINYVSDNRRVYQMQNIGQNVIYEIRKDAFLKLQKLSPSYYSKHETGRIMSYITNDVDALSDFVTFQLPQVLAGLATVIMVFPIMFYLNAKLTLVALIVVPPLVILTLSFQGKIQSSYVDTRKKIAIVTSKLQEGISGVRVTQSLVKEERVNENFDAVNAENLESNLKANRYTSTFSSLVQVIEAGGTALVIWFGATEVLAGQLSVGILVAFILYLNSFFSPIIQLTTFYNSYQAAVTGLDRVVQVLRTDIEVKEPSQITKSLNDTPGEIEFQHVTFGYDPDVAVLNDISLRIQPKEVVAVVGPTGAGKTSLVNLILRFYDPQKGRVLIDSVDLRELDFHEFRKKISVVPQDPFLFLASIMENIRYGREDATDEQVIEVAKQVGVDEFVRKTPEGYATTVNESATNLSMGQKQMICFARALIRDPKILILDEATSGVDPVTELQLQRALALLLENRTAIIIAHRLSTIRLADRIVVMNYGRIVEEGSFEELMSIKGGAFAKMYSMQFQET
jgi:ATP-binding cassette, subfamily B, multidrug efflux pump